MQEKITLLKEIRKRNKCTQEELAKLVGYGKGYIGKIESGEVAFSDKFAKKIIELFNVDKTEVLCLLGVVDKYRAEKKLHLFSFVDKEGVYGNAVVPFDKTQQDLEYCRKEIAESIGSGIMIVNITELKEG